MVSFHRHLGLSTLVLGGAMSATTLAQSPSAPVPGQTAPPVSSQTAPSSVSGTSSTSTDAARQSSMNPDDKNSYATGKPLGPQSKEGFWGHLNPMARKKWVAREVDPIKDRTNELDQLQAKNAGDIKDVDSRATAGISKAMMAANTADTHAADAASRANAAQSTATNASTRTESLNGTVSNLDQYKEVTSASVPFAAGHTTLNTKAKADLDEMATKLTGEKGYIIEVEGYSKGGVHTSQAMADAVVRYLVTEHQVPIYRIYRTGLGKQTQKPAEGETAMLNGVHVTLLHNSLASMDAPSATVVTPPQRTSQTPGATTQSN